MAHDILRSLDPDFSLTSLIRNKVPRVVARVQVQGKDCLLKTFTQDRFWKRPGRRLRLQKEIFIYSQLQPLAFNWFRHPELVFTDGRNYVLTRFIQNNPALARDDALFYTTAMQAVLEFNTCDFGFELRGCPGWMWEKNNRYKFSRSGKTLRNLLEGILIRNRLPRSLLPRLIGFWGQAMASTRKMHKPLLVHRDIFQGNILRPEPDKIYFVDFEKTGLEKRWVFVDALKIAQAEPLFFDQTCGALSGFPRFYVCQLQKFWEELTKRRLEINPEYRHFVQQLKFCLLGWTLKKLVKENPGSERKTGLIRFLEQPVTGPEHYFEKWFSCLPRLPEP